MPHSPAQVVVLLGPARSGKTFELVRQYRAALEAGPRHEFGRAIWLAPNGRTAAAVRDQLVRAGGRACLRPGILTFDNLATQILSATNIRLYPLDPVLQRDFLRRVASQALAAGKLKFFAESATRSGFVESLAKHIAELKRRNIGPDAYAKIVSSRTDAPQHRELALLYADYESQLAAHKLIDHESTHSAARDALAANKCSRFQNLDLVVADGFADFTRSEHDLLQQLARRTKQLVISLPSDNDGRSGFKSVAGVYDPGRITTTPASQRPATEHTVTGVYDPGRITTMPASRRPATEREDLFAKTTATLNELRHDFPNLEVRALDARPLNNLAIDFLAQHIFRHPKHIPPPSASVLSALPQLEIIETASAQDEVVQIARRVKSLLTDAPPGDILVVFRSLSDVAPRIREVFDRFGIPYALDAGQPIIAAPLIKTLLALLRLAQNDWPFRRVVSILTNNTLTALNAPARRAAEWLVRDLQIAAGEQALLDRVEALAADACPPNERSDHLQRRALEAAKAQPALTCLANALNDLPEKATPTQWCDAIAKLGATLGLAPFTAETSPDDAMNATDIAAWHTITTKFAALEHLDARLNQPPRQLTLSELLTALLDVAANEFLPRTHDDSGRVRVLAAIAARNATARHLFLGGMSEQSFPSPERAGQLANDADYRFFARSAHPQPTVASATPATRANAEMLLFYEMLTRAGESLTISYPALDDKAQTLPPSPYLVELQRILSDEEGTGRIRRTTPHLSPIPSTSAEPRRTSETSSRSARGTYCVPDWRIQALADAIDKNGDRRLLAGLFSHDETKPVSNAIDGGLRIVHARAHGDKFGPAEGLLNSPAAAKRLAERFGPSHAWSASQWESYAACPFRFFMEEVLGLEPLGDLILETDFARRGSRLHDVLAEFHRQWLDVRSESYASPDEEAAAFLTHLQQVIEHRTANGERVGIDAALLELDRRQILKWAGGHFKNQSKYAALCQKLDVTMTPTHFEFRFGSKTRDDSPADPDSTTNAFEIIIDGEPIRITGQIDRIDVGEVEGKTVFNVIDYKSGRRASLKPEQLATGQQLQLPLYVEAAQVLVFHKEAEPLQAGYWGMTSGFDSKGALAGKCEDNESRWKNTQAAVHKLIAKFIADIRQGDFPVASRDDKCTSTCDFHTICRVTQVRSIAKTWWPEAACGLAQNENEQAGDPLGSRL